jgi:hypothetical protein
VLLSRTKKQQHRLLQQPSQQPSNSSADDSDEDYGPNELDLHRSYSRPQLVKKFEEFDDDEELSDYVLARLENIRALAMEKYREKWG